MNPRPTPPGLPPFLGWAAPVVVLGTVVVGGFTAELAPAVPGPEPAVISVRTVLVAVVLGALIGSFVLVPCNAVSAGWLAVVAGAVLVPLDLPSWVYAGVVAGAVPAGLTHLRADVRRRALTTWPPCLVAGPPADVADDLRETSRGDLIRLVQITVGSLLIVGGFAWTAYDVNQVRTFRAEAVESVGRVVSMDYDAFKATIEVDSQTVVAPVDSGAPQVGAPIAVRWSPRTGRAEIMGDEFDPTGWLVWSTLGVALLAAAQGRHRRARMVRAAANAAALPGIYAVGHVQDELGEVELADAEGRLIGRLVPRLLVGVAGRLETDSHERGATVSGDERDVTDLTDEELVEHARALARLSDEEDDDEQSLASLLPTGPLDATFIVLVDGPLDPVVLARVGPLWMLATLTGPRGGNAATIIADWIRALRRGAQVAPDADSKASEHEPPAPDLETLHPRRDAIVAHLLSFLARSDALALIPAHATAGALMWWLLADPDIGVYSTFQLVIGVGPALLLTNGPRALARVHPRYLELRGLLWDTRVAWADVERVSGAGDATVVRYRRRGTHDAAVLDRHMAGRYAIVAFTPDDEALARIQGAWRAGSTNAHPFLPGTPSLVSLLGVAWLVLLLFAFFT